MQQVLYFGDHIFNDLREPVLSEGWKTGVIIKELENEVDTQNSAEYRIHLTELLEVERVIRECQLIPGEREKHVLEHFKEERNHLRGSK